jgi:hypothetical protein
VDKRVKPTSCQTYRLRDSRRDLRTAQLKGTRARLFERRVKPVTLSSGMVCQFCLSMYDLRGQLAEVNNM